MAANGFGDAARALSSFESAGRPADNLLPGGGLYTGGAASDVRWHTSRAELKARLQRECNVLRQVWCSLVIYLTMMLYGAAVLFRNIAFYRYRGLDWYADKVMPTQVSVALTAPGNFIVNASSGVSVPLSSALREGFYGGGSNITIATPGLRSNLSALHGELFNLKDFSQDYFVDYSGSEFVQGLNEAVAAVSIALTVAIFLIPLLVSFRGQARPHVVSMLHRWQRTLFTVSILRVPTYLATSIPGAAEHCQSVHWTSPSGGHGEWEVNQRHAETVKDMFFDTYNFFNNSNCGDLVYSGHIATALTSTLIATHYARRMLGTRWAWGVCILFWLIFSLQVFCVLTTRNHYTVDVVVACYTAPLNYIANVYFFPKDVGPKEEEHGELERDSAC